MRKIYELPNIIAVRIRGLAKFHELSTNHYSAPSKREPEKM
jgi:hypothetical protein